MLEQVCEQLSRWAEALPEASPSIDVNLSLRQFRDPNLVGRLAELLAKWKVLPGRLRLEVPEAVVNQDPEGALAVFQARG